MAAGTLVAWRKGPGDSVRRGEIVAEVETEKGVIEVEVFEEGVIERIAVQPGEKVPVGTVLAWLGSGGSVAPAVPVAASVEPEPVRTEEPLARAQANTASFASVAKPASPSARRLARELGVQLETLVGTGEHGVIVRADILRAREPQALTSRAEVGRAKVSPLARRKAVELAVSLAEVRGSGVDGSIVLRDVLRTRNASVPGPPPSVPAAVPLDAAARKRQAFRHAIASAMERSKREIPHYYLSTTIDFSAGLAQIERHNVARKPRERLVASLLFARAVALALDKVPELNAHWTGSDAPPLSAIHVGMAISVRGGGLVAPALFDVGAKTVEELAPLLFDLVERTRSGSLRSSELSAPTITVTSLGERGVDALFPIIFPPQVAIVGFGKVVVRPWVVDGMVVARPVVTVSLGADHRVSDGHRGGLFLAAVQDALEHPDKL